MNPYQVAKGVFVTFEGTEGAGKSTLIQHVASGLSKIKKKGQKIVVTREPGGSPVAEKIRSILLHENMDRWTELFLYEASRAEHLVEVILPALKRGDIVLCDRFADSSLAYQSFARGLPWQAVKHLNRIATQGVTPGLTVLLDINPSVGLKRARDKNRFEAEGEKFQIRVRRGFLKARSESPKRWIVLKVQNSPPEILADQVLRIMTQKFKNKLRARAHRTKKCHS